MPITDTSDNSTKAGGESAAAHTSGPWRLLEDAQGPCTVMHPTREGVAIANLSSTFGPVNGYHDDWLVFRDGVYDGDATCLRISERNANARLIAAAPDLLEALKAVNVIVADAAMTGFNCKDGDWADRLFASQWKTSEAIRKAEGRERKTLSEPARAEEQGT